MSAGLPKKAWHTLFDAVRRVPDTPLSIAVAQTNGFESLPDQIAELAAGVPRLEFTLDVNMPYDEVQSNLAEHGVLISSIEPGQPIGQPRSIIEGALAGIPLVVPDHPGTRGIVGECGRYYTAGDTASMTEAIRAALEAPMSVGDRRALAARVRRVHAAPDVFADWAASLSDAVSTWRKDVVAGGSPRRSQPTGTKVAPGCGATRGGRSWRYADELAGHRVGSINHEGRRTRGMERGSLARVVTTL